MLYVSASPQLDHHDTGVGHPERPERVPAALAGIEAAGLAGGVAHLPLRAATRQELELVHTAPYLQSLEDFCQAGGGHLDADTVASTGSWGTALLAAGGALAAVDALRAEGDGLAFVAHRPPGHHATADQAMGFCLLNTVAMAAASLVAQGERVLVLDWDVHHGNGTQAIFWDDPRVLYVSTHQWPLYPGTGASTAVAAPMPPGSRSTSLCLRGRPVTSSSMPWMKSWPPRWPVSPRRGCWFRPGSTPIRRNPLANLALSAGDFADMAVRARDFAPSPGRVVVVLEGGYDLTAVTRCAGAVLSGLLGGGYRPERRTSGGPGRELVERARRDRPGL